MSSFISNLTTLLKKKEKLAKRGKAKQICKSIQEKRRKKTETEEEIRFYDNLGVIKNGGFLKPILTNLI